MEKKTKIIVGISIAAVIAIGGVTSYFIITAIFSQDSLDSKIRSLMEEYKIPSLAAGIITNDGLAWSNGFGEQPDIDTVYMIGSITKSFTATAILQLYENNLLDLDDDINIHLPFDVRHPSYSSTNITIRMLLTHQAGLPGNFYWSLEYYFDSQMIDWINTILGWDIIIWEPRPTLGQFLNESLTPGGLYYNSYNWQSRPGSQYRYSNAGYQLLGYLVEQVANQSLESYVEENILEPLNMNNTGYYYSDFIDKHATPYEWNNTNIQFPLYNINVTGAGSLRSTIQDMTKFMMSFMNQGVYNGTQILSSNSVQLMHSIQVPLSGTSTEGYPFEGYGLGWWVFTDDFRGHGGAVPGFSANMVLRYANNSDLGIILMFNRGSALILDESLLNGFIPRINVLLLEEAKKLL